MTLNFGRAVSCWACLTLVSGCIPDVTQKASSGLGGTAGNAGWPTAGRTARGGDGGAAGRVTPEQGDQAGSSGASMQSGGIGPVSSSAGGTVTASAGSTMGGSSPGSGGSASTERSLIVGGSNGEAGSSPSLGGTVSTGGSSTIGGNSTPGSSALGGSSVTFAGTTSVGGIGNGGSSTASAGTGSPSFGGNPSSGGTPATSGGTAGSGMANPGGSFAGGAAGSNAGGNANCEYDIPWASGKVTSLDVDASGNVWFTDGTAQKIGKFDPQAKAFNVYSAAVTPYGIRFNPVDATLYIWGGAYNGGLFGTVNPTTGANTTFSTGKPVASASDGLIRSDGSFWFNGWDSQDVSRATPAGTVTHYTPPNFGYTSGLTEDASGNLWLTIVGANETNPRLLKFNMAAGVANSSAGFTEISLYAQASTVRGPRAFGNRIWFMVQDRSSIAYYDVVKAAVTTIPTRTSGAGVAGLELDSAGNPWFAEPTANNIGYYDTGTSNFQEYPIKTSNAGAFALSIDETRNVLWFIEQTANKLGCLSLTHGG